MKKTTTIKIDEKVLITAKQQIPNLSKFLEDCLRAYLGLDDLVINSVEANLEEIRKAKLNIHIITKDNEVRTADKEFDNKQKDNAWLKVWSPYRTNETFHPPTAMEVAGILEIDYNDLTEMMGDLVTYVPQKELALCDNYNYARSVWEKIKQ